jgi:hypothetical protein
MHRLETLVIRVRNLTEQLERSGYSVATKKESATEESEDQGMEERMSRGHALASDAEVFDQKGIIPDAKT